MDRWNAHNTTRIGGLLNDMTVIDAKGRFPYVRGGQLLRVEFMLTDIGQAGTTSGQLRLSVKQGSTQDEFVELVFPAASVDGTLIYQDFPERPGVLDEDWIEVLALDTLNFAWRLDAAIYILRLGNPAPITVPEDGPPEEPPE